MSGIKNASNTELLAELDYRNIHVHRIYADDFERERWPTPGPKPLASCPVCQARIKHIVADLKEHGVALVGEG